MNKKEKIEEILDSLIDDFSSNWCSHSEKEEGISSYAEQIIKLFKK